ncbi:MAG: 6-phosphogluconate dehydrogenase [Actinomycetia bacterium]|nr:6-phosphogluconate dehydrogenase [Actinomycetes bacterium]
MAERILAAGFPLTVYARRPEVLAHFAELGAEIASSPADLGRKVDVACVCVFTDAQAREVVLGPDGLLNGLAPGSALVNHTTGSPLTVREMAAIGSEREVVVLDVPVSGGGAKAGQGILTVLAAGPVSAFERCRPVFETYGNPVLHVGDVGDGQIVKLLNNALMSANLNVAVDALRLGVDLGLDPTTVAAAVVHCSGRSFSMELLAGGAAPDVIVEASGPLLRKDVAMVEEVAASLGVDLGLLGQVARPPA